MTHPAAPAPVVVLVDAENACAWLDGEALEALMRHAAEHGRVLHRRAYASWANGRCGTLARELNRFGFDLVHVYHPIAGKNSADVQMTVDAMDVLGVHPEVRTFVLVTGDADFSPLFRRLRERGRDVIGCMPPSALSESVARSCVRLIRPEDLRAKPVASSPPPVPAPVDARRRLEAATLLDRATADLADAVNPSIVQNRMRAFEPTFDHKALGYGSFGAFLRDHAHLVRVTVGAGGTPSVARVGATGEAGASGAATVADALRLAAAD